MRINYRFDGEFFDYEIDNEQYQKALISILMKESKESLVEMILCFDGFKVDLEDYFSEELKDHFEEKAYKKYKDMRYE